MTRGARHWPYRVGIAAWFILVLAGTATLSLYKSSPGRAATAPETWPAASSITRSGGRGTLLMFAHPRCTCTRASLTELARVLTQHGQRVASYVIFVAPDGVDQDWVDSDVVRRARGMPGVTVLIDSHGRETTRFGSATSGQVLYYEQNGRLAFSGGITAARGHEGENLGSARLLALLAGSSPDRSLSPVFGCELQDSEKR